MPKSKKKEQPPIDVDDDAGLLDRIWDNIKKKEDKAAKVEADAQATPTSE